MAGQLKEVPILTAAARHHDLVQITFVGCGDAFGSGGRLNTCFLVETGETRFLIDCGASSLIGLKRLGIDPDTIPVVFVSHLHGDHFGGLVFLLRSATLYNTRKSRLTVAGPPGTRERLIDAMEAFFPGGWTDDPPFGLEILELAALEPLVVGGLSVEAFPADHFSGAPSFSLRVQVDHRTVTYSGDTLWSCSLEDAAREADLFICEAYTFDKPRGTHLDLQTVRRNLTRTGARRTILTHLGPDMVERLSEVSCEFEVASDGLSVEI